MAPAVASNHRPTLHPEAAVVALARVAPLMARGGQVVDTTAAVGDLATGGVTVVVLAGLARTLRAVISMASRATWPGTDGTPTRKMKMTPKMRTRSPQLQMAPTGLTPIGMLTAAPQTISQVNLRSLQLVKDTTAMIK